MYLFLCRVILAVTLIVGFSQSGRVGMWSVVHVSPSQSWKGWEDDKGDKKADQKKKKLRPSSAVICVLWSAKVFRMRGVCLFVFESQFRLEKQQLGVALFLHYYSTSFTLVRTCSYCTSNLAFSFLFCGSIHVTHLSSLQQQPLLRSQAGWGEALRS